MKCTTPGCINEAAFHSRPHNLCYDCSHIAGWAPALLDLPDAGLTKADLRSVLVQLIQELESRLDSMERRFDREHE